MMKVTPPAKDGFSEWTLESWEDYIKLFSEEGNLRGVLANSREFIFRGQRDPNWEVIPSLTRQIADYTKKRFQPMGFGFDERLPPSAIAGYFDNENLVETHLSNFTKCIRGRIDPAILGSLAIQKESQEEVWAIGQHYGLSTPLLDWTTSPFVAAFFAFEEKVLESGSENQQAGQSGHRAVYALDRSLIDRLEIKVVEPMLSENSRLIAQGGLFTYIPNSAGICLEDLVKSKFSGAKKDEYVLIKILVPDVDRVGFLKLLNRFNINHLSLFPDLVGASKYCNLFFEIESY